jgi:2-dehydropantoate 2-reductase
MRTLVVGAGAVGGYFGGRLAEKGADVTFLVRPQRREQLERNGLVIRSVHGDTSLSVKTLVAGEESEPFDLVLLSVKAYHLEEAMATLAPYVEENTAILPLLNGIRHIDELQERFGEEKVLGGLCFVESTLNSKGEIEQYSPIHEIVFGELSGEVTERTNRIAELFSGANMSAVLSREIRVDMWKKYIFIAGMSGMTTLMRSSIGPILAAPHGTETYRCLLEEITTVARAHEPSVPETIPGFILEQLKRQNPSMKASMLRDMEKGLPVEADHLQGALIEMAPEGLDLPLLKAVYASLKIYELSREPLTSG